MRKYKVNEDYFDVLTEESSYWLGFLYADGYVRMKDGKSGELKLKLKNTDVDHIKKLLKHMESDHPIKCGLDNKSYFCQTSINSSKVVKRLFELGCVNNKTFKITLPDLPSNLITHFIRGYFDGDGSISKRKDSAGYNGTIVGNYNFISGVYEFLKIQGLTNIGFYKMGKIYSITIGNLSDLFKFKELLYNNNDKILCLERKKLIFDGMIKDFVSKDEFLKLIVEKNITTFNQYKSYLSFNKLDKYPRNPESEYNFKF
jgi:hypothetical protein